MGDASSKAFRDYATRISFNLSLSRNQVGHLAGVVCELENEELKTERNFDKRSSIHNDAVIEGGGRPNLFVTGRNSLERIGLIVPDPRYLEAATNPEYGARWKYFGPMYQLTPAGEHVVELLRIAGLIPQRASNENSKRKRRKKAA